jgi:PKD repeat protein
MKYFLAIFLSLQSLHAATYYVSKTGSDGAAGGVATPWLTIAKAATVAVAGDTVMIGNGDYDEHVYETTSGSSGNLITFKATNKGLAALRGFRIGGSYVKIDGLKINKFSGVGNTWGAAVRIEPTADFVTITNCDICDQPFRIANDFSFPASQTVYSPSSNFIAAGFVPGSKITLGACGFDHPTLGPLYYKNHDTTWTVATVTATTLTLTDGSAAWIADAGTGYWAYIRAGSGNSGFYALQGVESGPEAPQNCTITNNVIRDWASHAMLIDGDGWTMENNTLTRLNGYRWMTFSGSNHVFRRNVIRNSPGVLHFTEGEIGALDHPPGTGWYDYQAGMFAGSSDTGANQNVLFEENWFENLENQMGRVDDSHASTYDIRYTRNVFIGVTEQFSGGRDDMKWRNNTFFRCAWNIGGHPLTLGGLEADAHDGYELTGNIFAACGRQGMTETRTRGFYSTKPYNTGMTIDGNFVSSEEVTGFISKTGFSEVTGINGGDPVFYQPLDPDGIDNIPFTADDGLKVLPTSPAAALGGGALGVRSVASGQPVAHFRITAPNGWFEETGDNFDLNWLAQLPTQRGSVARPYTTPASIGEAPVSATFSADKSLSGVGGATTTTAINQYTWDFGDGSASVVTTVPTASHTFDEPGEHTVSLTVRNTAGATHTVTNEYTVTGLGPSDPRLITVPGDYSTIGQALTNAAPGDTIRISAGTYPERVSTVRSGTSTDKITVEGVGTVNIQQFNLKHSHYIIKRLTFTGTTTVYSHQFSFGSDADFNLMQDCIIDGNYAKDLYGLNFAGGGTDDASDNIIERTTIKRCWANPMLNLAGSRNIVRHCTIEDGWDVDFLRLFGANNVIQYNTFQRNIKGPEKVTNHPDFVQTLGNNAEVSYGHIIEGNIVRDALNSQLTQLSATGQPDIRDWTFRNNTFINFSNGASCTAPGMKYYNNVFYKVSSVVGGHALNFGSRKYDRVDTDPGHPEYPSLLAPVTSGNLVPGSWYNVEVPYYLGATAREDIAAVPMGINAIVAGKEYKVRARSGAKIVYNGIEKLNNERFIGVSGVTDFTKIGTDCDVYIYGYVVYKGVTYERDFHFQCAADDLTFTTFTSDTKIFKNILGFAHGAVVKNNVFLDCGAIGNNTNGWYSISTVLTGVSADYNYIAKGAFGPVRNMVPSVPVGGPGDWGGKGWYEPHGINGGDPKFNDFSNYDFRLLSGSPLRDAGVNLSGVSLDQIGTARPLGTVTDIGAFEYDDGSPPPPPDPDPEETAPNSPSALTSTEVRATRVTLAWTDNADNELAFELERSLDGTTFAQTNIFGPNVTTYQVTGLTAATPYYWRIRATNAVGNSPYSSIYAVTTSAVPPPTPTDPPIAPSGLTATALGVNAVALAWSDNSTDETSFELVFGLDGIGWVPLATIPANAESWAVPGLAPVTTYYFRIRAVNANGFSAWSNTDAATTAASPLIKRRQPRRGASAVIPE